MGQASIVNPVFDVIVVGSGASAAHAAIPLVEAGLRVLMLDAGHTDDNYHKLIPNESFSTIHATDEQQHRYFLGDRFEGIPFGRVKVGAQLTPPRQFISQGVDALTPLDSDDFSALRSLALGGLAAGWGAATMPYGPQEIRGWPIHHNELLPHYLTVADRIGVCGEHDDLDRTIGHTPHSLLPPTELDSNGESILGQYHKHRDHLNNHGLVLGRARLAAATTRHDDRGPLRYLDMEFWSDSDRAVYRPQYSVEKLRSHDNFTYRRAMLVEQFTEHADGHTQVLARNLDTRSHESFTCRRLILAAGVMGTARIVLRSFGAYDTRVPLVSTGLTYFSCLNWPLVGKPTRDHRHSLAQLIAHYDPDGTREHLVQAQFYSYRSLLQFKLVKDSPLATRESIGLMNMLQPYLVIVGVLHEDRPTPDKYLTLHRGKRDEPDRLHINYATDERVQTTQHRNEKVLLKLCRKLGCLPIKVVRPGHGASIHYGGSLPMTHDDRPLTTTPRGQLRATRSIYIADGATFPHLPCKGITFTLMANANRVGCIVRDTLDRS